MSDPTEATQANPHPVSEHRQPHEIARDERGPIATEPNAPVAAPVAAPVPPPPANAAAEALPKAHKTQATGTD